jgi:hypothetical protein
VVQGYLQVPKCSVGGFRTVKVSIRQQTITRTCMQGYICNKYINYEFLSFIKLINNCFCD